MEAGNASELHASDIQHAAIGETRGLCSPCSYFMQRAGSSPFMHRTGYISFVAEERKESFQAQDLNYVYSPVMTRT